MNESKLQKVFLERKFILPLVPLIAGAVMVFFDRLDGAVWAGMATTLVTGFYAVTGWTATRNPEQVAAEKQVSRIELGGKQQ